MMFDLDLSIRDSDSRPGPSHAAPSVPLVEDVMMNSMYGEDAQSESTGSKRTHCSDSEGDLPRTPDSVKRMRLLIDQEAGAQAPSDTPDTGLLPCPLKLPPPLVGARGEATGANAEWKELCRHAGLMREEGGVKEWIRKLHKRDVD